jgi:hypothetical protein
MQSGLASFMITAKALNKSRIARKGNVILACAVGETSPTPLGP